LLPESSFLSAISSFMFGHLLFRNSFIHLLVLVNFHNKLLYFSSCLQTIHLPLQVSSIPKLKIFQISNLSYTILLLSFSVYSSGVICRQ
jgi:hypothetical protein